MSDSRLYARRLRIWTALFVGTAGALVAWSASKPLLAPLESHCQCPMTSATGEPLPKPTGMIYLQQEAGLQETLDRLGYTINVPSEVEGHRVFSWMGSAHVSDRSDAVPADLFVSSGQASFRELGVQSRFGRRSTFWVTQGSWNFVAPLGNSSLAGSWISSDAGRSFTTTLTGNMTFRLSCPESQVASDPRLNADGERHVIALPALVGGHWVETGSGTGHWDGARWAGGYLLCWDDGGLPRDYDYQDVILLATGVEPGGRLG